MPASEQHVEQTVRTHITSFAEHFRQRYSTRGSGLRNLVYKANNPFIQALGVEIVTYSALMRSLDSSLGNALETIARTIAEQSYNVSQTVEGVVPVEIDQRISALMSAYASKARIPHATDLEEIAISQSQTTRTEYKVHKSDYHLQRLSDPTQHYLLELKIGGDLDNKKARSEKQALLEQYAILKYSTAVSSRSQIRLYFATAYNKFGDEEEWKQGRVTQFFGVDELLIGRQFWNFICDRPDGNALVLQSYEKCAPLLKSALEQIVTAARNSR